LNARYASLLANLKSAQTFCRHSSFSAAPADQLQYPQTTNNAQYKAQHHVFALGLLALLPSIGALFDISPSRALY
jgi:hypothetical protein